MAASALPPIGGIKTRADHRQSFGSLHLHREQYGPYRIGVDVQLEVGHIAVAAIYAQMERSVQNEIDLDRTADWDEGFFRDQRQGIYDALVESGSEGDKPDVACAEIDAWVFVIQRLKDRVLADEDYQMDALALDLPPEQSLALKQAMGISRDYFIDVPPDATIDDGRNAWGNILERVSGQRPNVMVFP